MTETKKGKALCFHSFQVFVRVVLWLECCLGVAKGCFLDCVDGAWGRNL